MTRKEKKSIVVLLTWLIVIGGIILVAVNYGRQLSHYESAIAKQTATIARLQRQIANKPALQNSIMEIEQLMAQSKVFMPASDKQSADALLLSRVKKIIEAAGGEIKAITPVNSKQETTNNSLINVHFFATQDVLANIIQEIGAANPMMNIVLATLTPVFQGSSRKRVETGRVQARIQVEGFFAAFDGGEK